MIFLFKVDSLLKKKVTEKNYLKWFYQVLSFLSLNMSLSIYI